MNANMTGPNRNKAAKIEVPTHLTLTALLSTGLTIILSLIYGVLSLLSIIYRNKCETGFRNTNLKNSFTLFIVNLYIKNENCNMGMGFRDIMTPHTVFVLSILTLVACVVCFLAACTLITVVFSENLKRYINIAVIVYVCCCIASLMVDLTFGVQFGTDLGIFNGRLTNFRPDQDSVIAASLVLSQLAAFSLMVLTLKGFLIPVITIVLLILLVTYSINFNSFLQSNEHSIHSVGALDAYDQRKRNGSDLWQVQNDNTYSTSPRGPETNPSYISDDDLRSRTPNRRELPILDYSNRSFERSESWHNPGASSSRPFSYLEEPKRPIPVKPPTSPAVEPQWRREEPQWRREDPQWRKEWSPAVPAPDYSPTSPRRLKSALKPSYM